MIQINLFFPEMVHGSIVKLGNFVFRISKYKIINFIALGNTALRAEAVLEAVFIYYQDFDAFFRMYGTLGPEPPLKIFLRKLCYVKSMSNTLFGFIQCSQRLIYLKNINQFNRINQARK